MWFLVGVVIAIIGYVISWIKGNVDIWLYTILLSLPFLILGIAKLNEEDKERMIKCEQQGGVILEIRKTKHTEHICVDPKFIIEVK